MLKIPTVADRIIFEGADAYANSKRLESLSDAEKSAPAPPPPLTESERELLGDLKQRLERTKAEMAGLGEREDRVREGLPTLLREVGELELADPSDEAAIDRLVKRRVAVQLSQTQISVLPHRRLELKQDVQATFASLKSFVIARYPACDRSTPSYSPPSWMRAPQLLDMAGAIADIDELLAEVE